MRQFIYLLIVIIVFSCNETSKAVLDSETYYEIDESIQAEKSLSIYEEKSFSQQDLINEKLQELYELIELKNNHPDFAASIELQLKEYTDDTIILKDANVSIKNIELKEEIVNLSDSLQKLKLHYEIHSNNFSRKDSIYTLISTKNITIDGEAKTSKKIKFQSIKN